MFACYIIYYCHRIEFELVFPTHSLARTGFNSLDRSAHSAAVCSNGGPGTNLSGGMLGPYVHGSGASLGSQVSRGGARKLAVGFIEGCRIQVSSAFLVELISAVYYAM